MKTATAAPLDTATSDDRTRDLPQYSLRKILGIWAAATVPMGLLAWVVTPWMSSWLGGRYESFRVGEPALGLEEEAKVDVDLGHRRIEGEGAFIAHLCGVQQALGLEDGGEVGVEGGDGVVDGDGALDEVDGAVG